MFHKLMIPLVASTAIALSACGEAPDNTDMADAEPAMEAPADMSSTIVDVAAGNPDFSTLVAAVQAAGLVETLSGDGPFTVFAPNNAAFDKLPAGTVQTLTTDDTETLGNILTNHVVAGEFMATDVVAAIEAAGDAGYTIETVNGATLTAMMDGENVVLRDATGGTAIVVATDVDADNGVIHVIDTVLMPA